MRVSEIDTDTIADYLRLEKGEYDDDLLESILAASKAYVRSYTGLADETIDEHEDMAIAVLVLCQDMYDNRSLYAGNGNANSYSTNKTVASILNMHRVNLL